MPSSRFGYARLFSAGAVVPRVPKTAVKRGRASEFLDHRSAVRCLSRLFPHAFRGRRREWPLDRVVPAGRAIGKLVYEEFKLLDTIVFFAKPRSERRRRSGSAAIGFERQNCRRSHPAISAVLPSPPFGKGDLASVDGGRLAGRPREGRGSRRPRFSKGEEATRAERVGAGVSRRRRAPRRGLVSGR
jgi:hypothetical protein